MITAPLTELSQALGAGRLSSVELVDGLLDRIARIPGPLEGNRGLKPRACACFSQTAVERPCQSGTPAAGVL